jgi:alpha-glucosidase (family GH31 glycosyl hydrolase)
MRKFLNLLFLIFSFNCLSQVTIVLKDIPKDTPKEPSIFISGDFEGWTGGNEKYALKRKNNIYSITLPKKDQSILFKFTLGSWKTAESNKVGESLDNRSHKFSKKHDTIYLNIQGWSHLFDSKKAPTISKNVFILDKEFNIPQLDRKRKIWMYLPADYKVSNESYPVVYMHDAQNIFDKNSSFSGEWNVDETLDKLFKEHNLKVIVVGIDNGGKKRLDEYSPWKNKKYGGGEGEMYVDFIANTLKPYIDKNYKTLTNKSNTGIIGSSMGGLISYYAALKHPEIFGKIGVYSPSFWFSPKVNEFTKKNANLKNTKMYFLVGDKEGVKPGSNKKSGMVSDMNHVINILKNQNFPLENIKAKIVPDGKHNEELWRTNFKETILWLFKESIKERTFLDAKLNENQLEINVSDGSYKIHFYTPKISETTFIPKGEEVSKTKSHAVVLKSEYANVKFEENSKQLNFSTKDISIKIEKKPFKISYWYQGKEITSEKNGYQKTNDFETIRFGLTDDEVLYGTGARALGMNRRGNRLRLYNRAHYGYEEQSKLMNFTIPLVISSKKYAIHFDNAPIGYLDLDSKKDNSLTYETISGRKTYQVIVGDSWIDLIDNYTNLTGKQPLPPRWALGNFSSRFGYHSQQETENTIAKFIEENIPVDAIILDLYWFGKTLKGTMGNLEVYKDSFPDMKGMVSRLNDKGVKTVLITEPFVVTSSKKWNEAVSKDVLARDSIGNPAKYNFYFGETGIIDIFKNKGKDWFWNIYKNNILSYGVKGLWGDLGEPEVLPSWVTFDGNKKADEIHNIYGHNWAKLIYEGYKKDFPNERPFILMRAGYSGSQRFGMIPWSGDVNRTWGGLQSQPEIALQMGMQGLGYMHSDLGGFAGANLIDNLYVRWLQYGVFQPIFRPHAQEEVSSEPIFRSEKAKKFAKKAIELRYKLLPYNYNLAFENNQKGTPLMRPIFFEEDVEKLMSNSETYLWGKDFLITPILKDSVKTKEIYFPKTANWFNFYFDEKIEGGQTKLVKVKNKAIPTYVRGGAFILMTELVQTTDNYKADKLELHYYYDASVKESERTFYNDDGLTANAFEKGNYEISKFKFKETKNFLEIDFKSHFGDHWNPQSKEVKLIIHHINWSPKKIKVAGKRKKILTKENTLTIPVKWNSSKNLKVKISLK